MFIYVISPGIVPFQPEISVFLLHWDDSFASASGDWNWQVLEAQNYTSQVWWATSGSSKSENMIILLRDFTTFCRGK
jgi:hypothetical protein